MVVVRNMQIKLDVPEDAHSVLDEAFEQFQQAAQHVADAGWSDDPTEIEDTKNTLHEQSYTDVREQTSLQSGLVQSARNLAAALVDLLPPLKGRDSPKGIFRLCVSSVLKYAFAWNAAVAVRLRPRTCFPASSEIFDF